jgi:hypothetical protein
MAEGGIPPMSDVFRPYERLVEITIMGKTFLVPERNSLLRAFQFISPETVPYGRFCWNQECQYCRVDCELSDEDQSHPILSCKFIVSEGMEISNLAPELVGCLRTKLGQIAAAPVVVPTAPLLPDLPPDQLPDLPRSDAGLPDDLPSSHQLSGLNGTGSEFAAAQPEAAAPEFKLSR